MGKPKAIICEIDGVLANNAHRLHFVDSSVMPSKEEFQRWIKPFTEKRICPEWEPDYEAFYVAMASDTANEATAEILLGLVVLDSDYEILFITGRSEKYRENTNEWFREKIPATIWDQHKLFMRPDGLPCICTHSIEGGPYGPVCCEPKPDHRPSHIVKKEIYEREIKDKYEVLFVLESDEADCAMYKGLGLQVLRVI